MKMPQEEYQALKEDFAKVAKHFEMCKNEFTKADGAPNLSAMWNVMHYIDFDTRHSDSHLFYQRGCQGGRIRVLSYLGYSVLDKFYSLCLHDAQIETALKKICKELDFS